ncbi:MAG TPA: transcriptional regulator [candidate division Zixibacteria bacterium]|jgi:heme exporter protein A|nr:transcriptional regulator [candidate division Zixibacteria bacterium]HBZ01303.1 transcriptional regulator [candidate division Zixibacteria bacterium]
MEIRLNIDGLAKAYPGRPVFSDISATVESGHRLVITGPNGSGKSTLVRVLCAFIRPTKGKATLEIGERKLTGLEMRPHIGLVSPDLVLYDELSALENLTFFAGVAGYHFTENELYAKLVDVGLDGRGADLVGSYSSGMKQRLKYCLALLRDPELLLLDEPTANLDDKGKEIVDKIIRTHKGVIVIATNEKTELEYGDQIIRLGQ